jgi:hypothetical protein
MAMAGAIWTVKHYLIFFHLFISLSNDQKSIDLPGRRKTTNRKEMVAMSITAAVTIIAVLPMDWT